MTDFTVRPASLGDAPQLGVVGPASYAAAYGYLWPEPAPLMQYLESYGEAAVRSAMEDENTKFWLAEADGTAIGFAMAIHKSPNPATQSNTGVELSASTYSPMCAARVSARNSMRLLKRTRNRLGAIISGWM